MSETMVGIEEQARALVAQMNLEEKASLCSGENFWQLKSLQRLGLPAIRVTDGPHGLRKQAGNDDHLGLADSVPATCFPSLAALGSSWDRDLVRRVGESLGEECVAEDVAVLLGPGINMKRHPLCGRNFEYFSEDPLLTGELAAGFVGGLQSRGVGASLKHFAAYNQETQRMIVDVVVDERSLREVYLRAFELVVQRAAPWTIMSSYNRVNGSYTSEHPWLLDEVLRREWGYRGLVVSDWMGTSDRVVGVEAGLDLEMPGNGGVNDERIVAAVQDGRLDSARLDQVVARVVELILRAGQRAPAAGAIDFDGHHALAREAAVRSAVLLKNDRDILPLAPGQRIAVIGEFARQPRFQGAGSAQVNAERSDNALDGLRAWVAEHQQADNTLQFAPGYDGERSGEDAQRIDEAVALARRSDVAVVFAGLPVAFDTEISDRAGLSLPRQHQRLIEAVAATGTPTAVVLHNGSAVSMDWLDSVDAVLEAYLAGQAAGSAVADLLVGRCNPSGRLAETFPLARSDALSDRYFPGVSRRQVQYREGLYIGYRYFNTVEKPVLFPFGHGLSYTQFAYSGTSLVGEDPAAQPLRVRVTVSNVGEREGEEVVQVYVRAVQTQAHRPRQQLAGFDKLALRAGDSADLEIALDERAFSWYDRRSGQWRLNGGEYLVEIGSSSRAIHAQLPLAVPRDGQPDTLENRFFQSLSAEQTEIPDEVFSDMLGRPIPAPEPSQPFTPNSTLAEFEETWLGRKVAAAFTSRMLENVPVDKDDAALLHIVKEAMRNTPLRSMVLASNGQFSPRALEVLLQLLNHRPLRALASLLRRG